eukprot:jgi/Mesvir1/18098/Mv09397-RA.3
MYLTAKAAKKCSKAPQLWVSVPRLVLLFSVLASVLYIVLLYVLLVESPGAGVDHDAPAHQHGGSSDVMDMESISHTHTHWSKLSSLEFWEKHFRKERFVPLPQFSDCLLIDFAGVVPRLTSSKVVQLGPFFDDDGDGKVSKEEYEGFKNRHGPGPLRPALEGALSQPVIMAGSVSEGTGSGRGCALRVNRSNSEYVELENSGNLQFGDTAPFTIEAWVMPLIADKEMTVVSKYNRGKWGQYMLKMTRAAEVFFHREVAPWGLRCTQPRLPLQQFSHIAVVYDGELKQSKIFINGTLRASQKEGPQDRNPETPVLFGAMQEKGQPTDFFDGVIDQIRIWEVARTPEQIQESMHMALTGSEQGLVGYWTFDECAGHRAKDKMGRHDGILHGGQV